MSDYTRWYRVGTVALTKNSKIVTGTGTFWLAAGLNPGDLFTVDASQFFEVQSIDSNTQLTLKTAYSGTGTSESEYAIIRNFTASLPAQVAAQTADLLNDFRQFVDLKMQSIHGKSAYQIACEKGYAGTESQWVESLRGETAYDVAARNGYEGSESEWLESLKAAGEWSTLNSRTAILTGNTAYFKNGFYRGANLGDFTPEHLASIRNNSFTDMWLGDYFTHDGKRYVIVRFDNKQIWLITWSPLVDTDNYETYLLHPGSGEEGEEGYIPNGSTNHYPDSWWFTNVRPYFEADMEAIFGEGSLRSFYITVPTNGDSNGNVTAWAHVTAKAHLPTLNMLGFSTLFQMRSTYSTHSTDEHPRLPILQFTPRFTSTLNAGSHSWYDFINTAFFMRPGSAATKSWGYNYVRDALIWMPMSGKTTHMCPIFIVG